MPPRARGPDDRVALGHEPGAVEVEQAGQELAAREVPQRAEEHDHMVLGDRGAIRTGHTVSMALGCLANSTPKIIVQPSQAQ